MKLSIITVNLNNRLGLERTLRSFQPFANESCEFIIIDGGSSDGSVEVLEHSKLQNLRWKSGPDSGIYDAMNKGLKRSSGKYAWFINSGDEAIFGAWYEKFLNCYANESSVYLCRWIGLDGLVKSPNGFLATLVGEMPACHQSILYPLDENPLLYHHYSISGDLAFTIEAIERAGANCLPDVISKRESGGISRSRSWVKRYETYQIVLRFFGLKGLIVSLLFRVMKLRRRFW